MREVDEKALEAADAAALAVMMSHDPSITPETRHQKARHAAITAYLAALPPDPLREKLEGLRELSARATRGEWKALDDSILSEDGSSVAICYNDPPAERLRSDASFIAAAVNLVRQALEGK